MTTDTDDHMATIEAARRAIQSYGAPPKRVHMMPETYAAIIGKQPGRRRARPCKLARRCAARGRGGCWS